MMKIVTSSRPQRQSYYSRKLEEQKKPTEIKYETLFQLVAEATFNIFSWKILKIMKTILHSKNDKNTQHNYYNFPFKMKNENINALPAQ